MDSDLRSDQTTNDRTMAMAADTVRARLGARFPNIVFVAGSGLGAVASGLTERQELDYGAIPGFPASKVVGHAGRLVTGIMEKRPLAVFSGRKHLYEGVGMEAVTFAVRLAARLGSRILILSNAAGSVDPLIRAGSLMAITDYANLSNFRAFRFPAPGVHPRAGAGTAVFSPRLLAQTRMAARTAGIPLSEGVYCVNLGPVYETRAEVELAQMAGISAVGMSTIPEAVAAARAGMEVLALSLITNSHVHGSVEVTHDEVLEMGQQARERFVRLLESLVKQF